MLKDKNMWEKKRRWSKKSNLQNIKEKFEQNMDALEGEVVDPEAIETEEAPDTKDKGVETDADMAKYLTPRQKLFCQYYASHEELLWNGVRSYIKAYQIDEAQARKHDKSIRTCSQRLLTNVIVCRYIASLLDLKYSDEFLDNQLWLLALQNDDRKVKIEAIKELNKLKQRITDKSERLIKFDWPLVAINRTEAPKEKKVETGDEKDIE